MAKKKTRKSKAGRKRIGQPISVTFTDEQRAWIDSQVEPGGTRTEVIRRIVQKAMENER